MGLIKLALDGITVGVIDERGEISAMYKGYAENDLGIRTDVLNNIRKSLGIEMLIRSMGPKVIICDEIGNKEDINAINYALCSGVKGIFTAHGNSIENIKANPIFSKMFELGLFEKVIILNSKTKGKILKVYKKNEGTQF